MKMLILVIMATQTINVHKTKVEFIPPEDRDMETLPPMDPLWAHILHCWHCGGKPCNVDHAADKRIRLKDLQFVRDLVDEKRELEKRVQQLLLEMEERLQIEEQWKLERLMLLRQLKEKEESEEKWKNERLLLEQEIQRLKSLGEKLQAQIDIYRRNEGKLEMLQLRLDSVLTETSHLKDEIKRLNESNYQKILEIQKLQKDKDKLMGDLDDMKTENMALKNKLSKVEKELYDLKNDTTKDDMIADLKKQVTQLDREKNEALRKNEEYQITIRQLTLTISELKLQFQTSEQCRLQLEQEVAELMAELEALKRRINADKTFRKFVSIKRELNDIKDENEDLRDIVKTSVSPWPNYMKEDTTINPSKIAQRAVEIVSGSKLRTTDDSGSKFTPRSPQTIGYDLGSQSSRVASQETNEIILAPNTSRPSSASGVRFADNSYTALNRPKTASGNRTLYKASSSVVPKVNYNVERASSAIGMRGCRSRSPKTDRRIP